MCQLVWVATAHTKEIIVWFDNNWVFGINSLGLIKGYIHTPEPPQKVLDLFNRVVLGCIMQNWTYWM